VKVELFGLARALAGTATVEIAIDEPTNVGSFIRALLGAYPILEGSVIDGERAAFIEPNLLLLDGRRAPLADETFESRDKPCVLFLASGG